VHLDLLDPIAPLPLSSSTSTRNIVEQESDEDLGKYSPIRPSDKHASQAPSPVPSWVVVEETDDDVLMLEVPKGEQFEEESVASIQRELERSYERKVVVQSSPTTERVSTPSIPSRTILNARRGGASSVMSRLGAKHSSSKTSSAIPKATKSVLARLGKVPNPLRTTNETNKQDPSRPVRERLGIAKPRELLKTSDLPKIPKVTKKTSITTKDDKGSNARSEVCPPRELTQKEKEERISKWATSTVKKK
jgi:hypothetical protein